MNGSSTVIVKTSLQMTVNPHGNLKGVVQLISKKDVNGGNQPTVEWGLYLLSNLQSLISKLVVLWRRFLSCPITAI